MISVNKYLKQEYGEKYYKISLDAGFTCPVRDGKLDTRGCIFCSGGGSGEFSTNVEGSLDAQIEEAKMRVNKKYKGDKYIAYFQAFTNTYASVEVLRGLYLPIIKRDDIAILSIATRPDCINDDILLLLKELNAIKPVWVELGLQTTNPQSVKYIRRNYDNEIYDRVINSLNKIGIHTITHVIIGLPNEFVEDYISTIIHALNMGTKGIKLQLLHVLSGTDLACDYKKGLFKALSEDEYFAILHKCLPLIGDRAVLHRVTGDGPKSLLIAPLWSANKRHVLNRLKKEFPDLY